MSELETAQQRIAELEARVQELGEMARDVNSRRVVELEAELAAMRAGGEPVAEMVPCHTPSGKRVAIISRFQHLPIGTKLYTHPQPAAHAERKPLTHEQAKYLVSKYGNDPLHLVFQVEVWHGIAAQQGEKS